MTTAEEKQKKIDSVKIDFSKDNILPKLNREDARKTGITANKNVRLKKSVIDRNELYHSDLKRDEYDKMIGESIYNKDLIIRNTSGNTNYFHFIKYQTRDNFVTLLDCKENAEFIDIVHLHKMEWKKLIKLIRKNK